MWTSGSFRIKPDGMPPKTTEFRGHILAPRTEKRQRCALILFENFRRRAVVKFGKTPVKRRHGIETVLEDQFGKIGIVPFFCRRDDIPDAHHIDIIVQIFPDIGIEQPGKIIFVIPEFGGNRIEGNGFGVMLVDVIQCLHDHADLGVADAGMVL